MTDTRAAPRAARLLVYGAGLAQGLALVSFPAASSILTSPTEFPRLGATSSGELIAGYQVGYGVTAFGVAPLQSLTGIGMSGIYLIGAGIAVAVSYTHLTLPTKRIV